MHVLGLMVMCWFFILLLLSSPLLISGFLVLMSILLGMLIGVWSGVWHMYIMGLVFTGGMMVMILYVTNLCESSKNKASDFIGWLGALSMMMFLACTTPTPLIRPWSTGVMGEALTEVLCFGLGLLLVGLFLVVNIVDKKMGSLR